MDNLLSSKYGEFFDSLFVEEIGGILFLDIDGCLNSQDFYEKRLIRRKNFKIDEKNIAKIFPEYNDKNIASFSRCVEDIDYEALDILNNFCIKNNLEVVISSTWRSSGLEFISNVFRYCLGLKKDSKEDFMNIIDITPFSKDRIRGVEIHKWMQLNITPEKYGCHYFEYNKYIIIDDDSDMMLWQKDNFFKSSIFTGITKKYLDKIQNFVDSKIFNINKIFKEKMVTLVACVDRNMGIGFENEPLVVFDKEFIETFPKLQYGKILVGYKTFINMNNLGKFDNNNVVVVTNERSEKTEKFFTDNKNILVIDDLEKFLLNNNDNILVIGGEEIFNQTILTANKMVITHLDHKFENVDKYFPEIDTNEWFLSEKTIKYIEFINDVKFSYCTKTYLRKNGRK